VKRRGFPSGFRKLVLGVDAYYWRFGKRHIEIRTPGGKRLVVPKWELKGMSEKEWRQHLWDECHEPGCCGTCYKCTVSPNAIREYIEKRD